MRRIAALASMAALLAACGGGGGTATAPATVAPASTTDNVLPVSVEPGPADAVNLPYVSVTVCAPGSAANCQTISHVVVDTASSGLRLLASVLTPALAAALPQQTDDAGAPVVECAQFASGYTWGPVKIADVRMAGERAASLPVQVIADPAFGDVPAACSSTGPAHNSVQTLLANGILGVGMFREDCGAACAQSAATGVYYGCPPSGCTPIALGVARQVQNPVARFATHNNGIVLQLPPVPAAGAVSVSGSLVFGIGTQANNALGSATVLGVDAATGTFTTVYQGRVLNRSFVDSGSNGYFFNDPAIPRCASNPSFYCPPSTLALTATMQGTNGTMRAMSFSVANTDALLQNNPSASAFDNLAGPLGTPLAFDWGLPFFYGRSVYVAFVGASTPAGAGPYLAF